MKRWLACGLCAAALLGCEDREAPPMKRMDGMRPVAPVQPARPDPSPSDEPAELLGGARPIPTSPTAVQEGADVVTGEEEEVAAAPARALLQDEQLLKVYHAVICHRRRGDEKGVKSLWAQHGYTASTWAETVEAAVRRAVAEADDFGKAWAGVLREPCVP